MTSTDANPSETHLRKRRLTRFQRLLLVRLALIPITLIGVVTLSFLLVEIMPGDPALVILGNTASADEAERIRTELGLDLAFGQRYVDYMAAVFQGDLGNSFFTGRPVLDDILRYLPASLELVTISLFCGAVIGISLGAIAGYWRDRAPDGFTRIVVTTIQALPDFLIGLLLIFALFYLLRIVPAPLGRLGLLDTYPPGVTGFLFIDLIIAGDWSTLASALRHSVMPVATLTLASVAYFAKTTRAAIGTAMFSRHTQFARACGLPERQVLRCALLVARTPILTYTAILFAAMVGGSSIIETMFSWQGLGQWGLSAILALDIPAIQGFVIATGLLTMLVYLTLDILVAALDPRVRHD